MKRGLLLLGILIAPALVHAESYEVQEAREACDEYKAAVHQAGKGVPFVAGEIDRRKQRCEQLLQKAQIDMQADTARRAASAMAAQKSKADSVVMSWAQANQGKLLKTAKDADTRLQQHDAALQKDADDVEARLRKMRPELQAAREAGDDDAYRRVVQRMKPLEHERNEVLARKARLAQRRSSLRDAVSSLERLQDATGKLDEALTLKDNLQAGEYGKATQTVLSKLKELNDERIQGLEESIDQNLGETWDDLHRRLADEGVLKSSRRIRSGFEALDQVNKIKEVYDKIVAHKETLAEIERDPYSPRATKDAAAAFATMGRLLDEASDYLPDSMQNLAKGTAAALSSVNDVRAAVSRAEAQRSQNAINTNTMAGQERTEEFPELDSPDSDGVLTVDRDFENDTGIQVYVDNANENYVYINGKDGKLERISREEFDRRRNAIARLGELTDGQASKDDYETLLQGGKVTQDDSPFVPNELDSDALNDPENQDWIRREARERAAAEQAYSEAFTPEAWDELSDLEKLQMRQKWRDFQELSRRAGRGDPTPNQFNAFLNNEEAQRQRLDELIAQREKDEEQQGDDDLDAALDEATDDSTATSETDSIFDEEMEGTDEQRDLLEQLLADGDLDAAADLYQEMTGADPDEADAFVTAAADDAQFVEDTEDRQGTSLGSDEEVADLDELPDDETLLDEEGEEISLGDDTEGIRSDIDVDEANRDASRRRDGRARGSGRSRAAAQAEELMRRERGAARSSMREHERTVQEIERQTARNRANHQRTVREAFGRPPDHCPAGLIPCGCPETHDYVWCHPEIPGGCSQKMSRHDFDF